MKKRCGLLLLLSFYYFAHAQVGYISTIAGTGIAGYSGNGGPATSAKLYVPFGILTDAVGNIYFADNMNNVIRKIQVGTGIITKVAGTYYQNSGLSWYYGGDGGLATSAYLANPFGLAMDTAGNLYFSDNYNNVIRKISAANGIITTVAGDGSIFNMPYPFCGDGGPATSAQLSNPWGIAVDISGNIYIADRGNQVIRKVTAATGIITTVAGNGTAGYSGNGGPATSASLNGPNGITLDSAGNMYISEVGNNVIRKVSKATGIITTLVGTGTAGYSGDNGPATAAKINDPSLGIAFDASGNFYFADDGNNVIRKVNTGTGIITTVAGNGLNGYSGDNGPATAATLNGPEGVALDAQGNIYITDENHTIRKVNGPGGAVPTTPTSIIGNTTTCLGAQYTYTANPVSGATSYTWTLPNGWTGSSTTNVISTTAGSSGVISVTANNLYGSSVAQSINVTVNSVNTLFTQQGNTLSAQASGASYQWVNCNGFTPISGQTLQNYTPASSGTYAVIVGQNACIDTSNCVTVYIAGPPPIPDFITGNAVVCYGTTNTYSIPAVNGASSYTWTLSTGLTGSSTSNTINITALSSGVLSVVANNSFGPSASRSLSITVNTVDVSVTQNGSTLSANTNGATYQWIGCNPYSILPGQTFQSFHASSPGSYAVIITQYGCCDTSSCTTISAGCGISITGADLPHNGLSVMLANDTTTAVNLGNPAPGQVWNYSALLNHYPKFADYHATSSTSYAATYPASNIYTYGPGNLYGSLYGGAPVGQGNGYCFWKSDTSGFWVMGFRPSSGIFSGIDVQNSPPELVIGAPASYGSVFYAYGRWELPLNHVPTDVDTFYVRTIKKRIVADACGALTTPHGYYPTVLRQHEYITEIDSVFGKINGIQVYALEYLRDSSNTYTYIANGIGYPVCTVHADKNNVVKDVEYYNGTITGMEEADNTSTELSVFPNPASRSVHIFPTEGSSYHVYIYDINGHLMFDKMHLIGEEIISTSDYPSGVYLIKAVNREKTLTSKLIIVN